MQQPYTSLKAHGESRYEEKKSVFFGFARPLTTEAEALAFIDEIKRQYPDARHHVYAYLLRDRNLMRYSDDREPQGTAGLPVLDVLRKTGCTDAGIVVVRYFGGTLLGTGGLVRAYTAAAQEAVAAAGAVTYRLFSECTVKVGYADYQRLPQLLEAHAAILDDTLFADSVEILFAVEAERVDSLRVQLSDLTGGRAEFALRGSRFAGN